MSDLAKGAIRSQTERGDQAATQRSYQVLASSTVGGAASIATKERTIEFDASADHNIRRHGTIFNTLAAVCEVTGDIVAEPTGSAPR